MSLGSLSKDEAPFQVKEPKAATRGNQKNRKSQSRQSTNSLRPGEDEQFSTTFSSSYGRESGLKPRAQKMPESPERSFTASQRPGEESPKVQLQKARSQIAPLGDEPRQERGGRPEWATTTQLAMARAQGKAGEPKEAVARRGFLGPGQGEWQEDNPLVSVAEETYGKRSAAAIRKAAAAETSSARVGQHATGFAKGDQEKAAKKREEASECRLESDSERRREQAASAAFHMLLTDSKRSLEPAEEEEEAAAAALPEATKARLRGEMLRKGFA